MTSIAHIIHPVEPPPGSDLVTAQPITFETMQIARAFAGNQVAVELFYLPYADESPPVPVSFRSAGKLLRSVADVKPFLKRRKLALIRDILDSLYASSDAEYFIYTNVDIAVMPYFYTLIHHLIHKGYDALAINRRTIPESHHGLADLPLMFAAAGAPHPGHDCFVFRRDRYEEYLLGDACIGCDWIGKVLLFNLIRHADNFTEFSDLHATFHLGDRRDWKRPGYEDYDRNNADVLAQITTHYKTHPGFMQHPIVQRVVARLGLLP